MNIITHAIILAAGSGTRLLPFTLTNPKCFTRVGKTRILENTLNLLVQNGCQTVSIVVGHFAELIHETITEKYHGMDIEFITNKEYKTTNSMYSLALALEKNDTATWVIEGDVFLENTILSIPMKSEITWFVDSSCRHLDGAFVESDANQRAISLQIVRDLSNLNNYQSKSIGVLQLGAKGVKKIRTWLKNAICEGRKNIYYDIIIGEHLDEIKVTVADVAGRKWYEIDTHDDLIKASMIFRK